jgi:hypothetical protein
MEAMDKTLDLCVFQLKGEVGGYFILPREMWESMV